jgi:heme exporter protein D
MTNRKKYAWFVWSVIPLTILAVAGSMYFFLVDAGTQEERFKSVLH